jgi:hypothetical protein
MRPSAERLHDEITADYTEMIYAATPDEIAAQGLHSQVAAQALPGCRKSRGSRRSPLHFRTLADKPMEKREDNERD